jgi:hypothetical protein
MSKYIKLSEQNETMTTQDKTKAILCCLVAIPLLFVWPSIVQAVITPSVTQCVNGILEKSTTAQQLETCLSVHGKEKIIPELLRRSLIASQ